MDLVISYLPELQPDVLAHSFLLARQIEERAMALLETGLTVEHLKGLQPGDIIVFKNGIKRKVLKKIEKEPGAGVENGEIILCFTSKRVRNSELHGRYFLDRDLTNGPLTTDHLLDKPLGTEFFLRSGEVDILLEILSDDTGAIIGAMMGHEERVKMGVGALSGIERIFKK